MRYYIVYDKKDGEILHMHSVFDGSTGTYVNLREEDVLSAISDFIPEPEKVDVLTIDARQPVDLWRMRVNPREKKLEKTPLKKKKE